MGYILLYSMWTSCNNLACQKTLICNIYPAIMTKVNVSAILGMSATVGEMSATVGEMSATVGEMSATVGEMSATVDEMSATVEKLNLL